MAITRLLPFGVPGKPQSFSAKTPANYPAQGLLVDEFDLFVQGYAGKVVTVLKAGTTDLMPCYSDPSLTEEIENPITLITKTDGLGNTYGKFPAHVYVPFAYELEISGSEETGVKEVPIYTLAGEDASEATVKATGSTEYRTLAARASDDIRVADYGELGESSSTNAATITAAISAASARGGGRVLLPAGVIPFTSLQVPTSVILQGEGREVTVLQSQLADKVITLTGDAAGLVGLQLDGVNLLTGSYGVFGRGLNDIIMDDVLVRRFNRNFVMQGGQNHVYRSLYSRNAVRGMELLGDLDSSGTGNGDEFSGLDWISGEVSESTEVGLLLKIVDRPVRHNTFRQVDFLDNVGADGALYFHGASWQKFDQCYWDGNITNWKIKDNPDEDLELREVSNLFFQGGQATGGTCIFDGLCQDIILDSVELDEVTLDMTTPQNPILMRDCTEISTLFSGDTTKAQRFRTTNQGQVKGLTTTSAVTQVWKMKLKPNEVVQLLVSATAERVDGAGYADWLISHSARCAGATLAYDSQTANFTAGKTIQGSISGATAIIVSDSDSGTTGTLTLAQVNGEFVDNETITETDGSGSATVNGTLTLGAAALIASATALREAGSNTGAPPSGYAIGFVALGQEISITVTTGASHKVVWNVDVKVTVL